jgi:branched-chain amino acid aminotransferase
MLDYRGFISEGPGENLFIVEKNIVITPPLHASILRGITRDTVIVLARELGFKVKELDIHRSRLYHADEALFTGTAAEIAPIHEVDNMKIGRGETGPITKKLQETYFNTIRNVTSNHTNWLTYVYE